MGFKQAVSLPPPVFQSGTVQGILCPVLLLNVLGGDKTRKGGDTGHISRCLSNHQLEVGSVKKVAEFKSFPKFHPYPL